MQEEQSSVGKVLSTRAMLPPMVGSRSTRVTGMPASAMSMAAWMPAMPPPMTRTSWVTDTMLLWSGLSSRTLATPLRTSSMDFCVPVSMSGWIQEHCSRMLTISNMNGFMPAWVTVRRKVVSCMRGEQAASTTRVSAFFCTASMMTRCPGSEQL